MCFTVEQIERFYRIEAVDYGAHREGTGLLIGAGTGMMMSMMDQVPSLRYCVDSDIFRPDQWERFPNWLTLMERACGVVASAGWWSRADNGLKLARAFDVLQSRPLVYYGILERPTDWAHCEPVESHALFVQILNERARQRQNIGALSDETGSWPALAARGA